jgi:hypothetical protein
MLLFTTIFEIIQHFYCHFVRSVWNIVPFVFGIQPPTSIANIFGSWLNGLSL